MSENVLWASPPESSAGLECELRSINLVEQMATRRLATNGSYVHAFRDVTVRFEEGVLTLTGRIPTFYLKQVLQTLLKNLDGVEQIDNRVEVTTVISHRRSSPNDT